MWYSHRRGYSCSSSSKAGRTGGKSCVPLPDEKTMRSAHLRFHSVDSEWQLEACNLLGLPLHGPNGVNPGGPNLALTSPASYKSIQGDGNCLFRSLSYLITGSCSHYRQVRETIIEIRTLAHLLRT